MAQKTYYKAVRIDDHSGKSGAKRVVTGDEVAVDDDPGTIPCYASVELAVTYQSHPADYCEVSPLLTTGGTEGDTEGDADIIHCRRLTVGKFLDEYDLIKLEGFNLWKLNRPVNPLTLQIPRTWEDLSDLSDLPEQLRHMFGRSALSPNITLEDAVIQLRDWARVLAIMRASAKWVEGIHSVSSSIIETLEDSPWDDITSTVEKLIGQSSLDNIWWRVVDAVSDSVGGFVRDSDGESVTADTLMWSVVDAVWAYVGGLFHKIEIWKYAEEVGWNPWRPLLRLWHAGYVPSFDGELWRLHKGPHADIVWEGRLQLVGEPIEIWYVPLESWEYALGHCSMGDNLTYDDAVINWADPGAYRGDTGIRAFSDLQGAFGYGSWYSKYAEVIPKKILVKTAHEVRCRTIEIGRTLMPEEVDAAAGFKLSELSNPVNPLEMDPTITLKDAVTHLWDWAKVRTSVRAEARQTSVEDIVGSSVSWPTDYVDEMLNCSRVCDIEFSVSNSVEYNVWDNLEERLLDDKDFMDSLKANVRDSLSDCVWAYVGGLFPITTDWKNAEDLGNDPWRPLLTLWYAGYVPSFDGTLWRLHTGPEAKIVWDGVIQDGHT